MATETVTQTITQQVPVDPLKQALSRIIDTALQGVDKSIDFLQSQLPDVIQQLLVWKAVYSFIWFSVGLMLLGITFLFVRSLRKEAAQCPDTCEGGRDREAALGFAFGATIVGPFISMFFWFNNLEWLQILVAPKIYLIEYAATLLR